MSIESIRTAAEPDELVEVAVVVEVGPRVRLPAGHAEEFRLNEFEAWADVRCGPQDGEQRH